MESIVHYYILLFWSSNDNLKPDNSGVLLLIMKYINVRLRTDSGSNDDIRRYYYCYLWSRLEVFILLLSEILLLLPGIEIDDNSWPQWRKCSEAGSITGDIIGDLMHCVPFHYLPDVCHWWWWWKPVMMTMMTIRIDVLLMIPVLLMTMTTVLYIFDCVRVGDIDDMMTDEYYWYVILTGNHWWWWRWWCVFPVCDDWWGRIHHWY